MVASCLSASMSERTSGEGLRARVGPRRSILKRAFAGKPNKAQGPKRGDKIGSSVGCAFLRPFSDIAPRAKLNTPAKCGDKFFISRDIGPDGALKQAAAGNRPRRPNDSFLTAHAQTAKRCNRSKLSQVMTVAGASPATAKGKWFRLSAAGEVAAALRGRPTARR